MSTSSAVIEKLTRRLLATEATGTSRNAPTVPAFCICEKLRAPLTKLAGGVGYSSLLSRALVLTARQVPSRAAVRVEADGSLTGIEAMRRMGTSLLRSSSSRWGLG